VEITPEDRALLTKVAEALGFEPESRFIEPVWGLTDIARVRSRLFTRQMRDDPKLKAAAKAVRAAKAAVAKLTLQQRAQLGVTITLEATLVADYTPDIRAKIVETRYWWLLPPTPELQDDAPAILLDALDDALGAAISRPPEAAPTGKRGKPKGTKINWPAYDFVYRFWYLCHMHRECLGFDGFVSGKSRITLSGKSGKAKGTIVIALDLLKPMLPKEFFPSILDYPFLHKVQKSMPRSQWEEVKEAREFLNTK
jgi:hypothetical protein